MNEQSTQMPSNVKPSIFHCVELKHLLCTTQRLLLNDSGGVEGQTKEFSYLTGMSPLYSLSPTSVSDHQTAPKPLLISAQMSLEATAL